MSGVYVQGNVQISCLECDNVTSGHQARGSMGQDPPPARTGGIHKIGADSVLFNHRGDVEIAPLTTAVRRLLVVIN